MLTKVIHKKLYQRLNCMPTLTKTVKCAYQGTSTVDDYELSHFKTINKSWWDQMGEMKPLHSMNMLRVPLIRDGLINTGLVRREFVDTPKPLRDLMLLDVGCGGDILAEPLFRLGGVVTGLDPSQELIEEAVQHAKLDSSLSNLCYLVGSIEEHAASNSEKYDAVIASEVLDHVSNKNLFLESCVKCIKPGGSVFVSTVSRTTASWVGVIFFAENVFNIIPKGTHRWGKFITPHETQNILEEHGCRRRAVCGMFYNLFSNTWHWITDTSISYALHAVKE